tara:strand:- start:3002 stop:3376 length:375 start_codon:yes stop_codon:yes gene_type:complete
MKSIIHTAKRYWFQASVFTTLMSVKALCFADNYTIPTSSTEQTQAGQSVFTTIMNVIKTEFLPFFEVLLGIAIFAYAIMGMIGSYKEAKEKDKPAIFLKGLALDILLIVAGAVVIYLLDQYRTS